MTPADSASSPSNIALVALAQKAGPGSTSAELELVGRFTPLVTAVAVRTAPVDFFDDARQEGFIAVVEAGRAFDLGRGTSFEAYISRCVDGKVRNAVRREQAYRDRHTPLSHLLRPDRPKEGPDPRSARLTDVLDLRPDVLRILAVLTPRERYVVRRVFWDGLPQSVVASELGLSKMAITKILHRVRRKAGHTPLGLEFHAAAA